MYNRLFLLIGVLLLGGLVACQTTTPDATLPLPDPTSLPQPTAVVPTRAPTATLPVAQLSPTSESPPAPTSLAVEARPSPTPTVPWQIPNIQPDDWVQGEANAGLTLVEYGDFQ